MIKLINSFKFRLVNAAAIFYVFTASFATILSTTDTSSNSYDAYKIAILESYNQNKSHEEN